MWAALIAIAVLSQAHTFDAPPVAVRVSGNVALPNEVYTALIDKAGLVLDKTATAYHAGELAEEIEEFLVASGYEIAQVSGNVAQDGSILIDVDEGLLTRIIYRGINDFRTAQLRLTVSVPGNIFNRPHIQRQIEAVQEEFGITSLKMELVESSEVDHFGLQIIDFGEIAGVDIVPKTGRYNLVITVGRVAWATGFGINLDLKPPDGVKIGGAFSAADLVLDNDRWQLRADVAVNQFGNLVNVCNAQGAECTEGSSGSFVGFSRATALLTFSTPPLFGSGLRPRSEFFLDFQMRQRPDLGIQTYKWLRQGLLFSAAYEFAPGIDVSLGVGYQARWLLDVESPSLVRQFPAQEKFDELVGIVDAKASFVFDPDNIRLDRRHELEADARLQFGDAARFIVRGQYQKYFEAGWHDIIVRARALGIFDSSHFVDQESMGFFLRGVFGSRHWVKRAAGSSVEFRFSLTRDLFKIGVFQETAVFEKPSNPRPCPGEGNTGRCLKRPMVATSQGIGLHFLILDTFQADFYYSFGIDSDLIFNSDSLGFQQAFSASLRKAF